MKSTPVPIDKIQSLFEYRNNNLYWIERPSRNVDISKPAGTKTTMGRRIKVGDYIYYAHRLVWAFHTGKQPPLMVCHVDKDNLNNNIFNLFEGTMDTYQQRRAKVNKSKTGRIGITKSNRKKAWVASIRPGSGVPQIFKSFLTEAEAIAQRVAWEKEYGYKNT